MSTKTVCSNHILSNVGWLDIDAQPKLDMVLKDSKTKAFGSRVCKIVPHTIAST